MLFSFDKEYGMLLFVRPDMVFITWERFAL